MGKYIFRLDRMFVKAQRGEDRDLDIVIFGITIGNRKIGPLTFGVGCRSGDSVNFLEREPHLDIFGPPQGPQLKYDPGKLVYMHWGVGPTEMRDHDVVNVAYSVVNVADTEGHLTTGDVVKISLVTWGALVAIGASVGGPVGAVVGAVVGALAAVGAELADILFDEPNCNGVVGADKVALSGAQLREMTSSGEAASFVSQSGNPSSPEDCHPSEIEVGFSVVPVPEVSLRQLYASQNLRPDRPEFTMGIRLFLQTFIPELNTPVVSLRSLVET